MSNRAIVALFVTIGFLIYGYSVWNNQFVSFDDGLLIYDNISVIRAGSLWSIAWAFANYDPELYIPLTFLSLQLDAIIGGMHPFIFHLNNLFLHIANALLITWILRILFKRLDIAIILGLLFLMHPLNVESVAWAASRKDVLSSFFFFASIVAYLRYKETLTKGRHRMSIGLFITGLFAKVSIIPLPFVLLYIDRIQDGAITLRDVWQKKWYFLAAIPFGLLALLGKDVVLVRSSPVSIALLIPKSIVFYLQKLFVPVHLSIFYPIDPSLVSLSQLTILIPIIIIAASIGCLLYFRASLSVFISGVAIIVLLLAPSFFQYYRGNDLYIASDRYMYMAFLGVCICSASLWVRLSKPQQRISFGFFGVLLPIFGWLTIQQTFVWQDTSALFTNVLRYNESFLAYEKIGSQELEEGKLSEAIAHLQKSIELAPNSAAFVRLGLIAEQENAIADAKLFYVEALKSSPENAQAHTNLSRIYWEEGNVSKAIEHGELAVENHAWNMMALGNLATMYTLTGQKEKAMKIIEDILLLEPNNERVQPLLRKLGE